MVNNYASSSLHCAVCDCDMCKMFCALCRKVYLGYKKSDPCRKYAIKVMKKADMINKNMANQGTCVTWPAKVLELCLYLAAVVVIKYLKVFAYLFVQDVFFAARCTILC